MPLIVSNAHDDVDVNTRAPFRAVARHDFVAEMSVGYRPFLTELGAPYLRAKKNPSRIDPHAAGNSYTRGGAESKDDDERLPVGRREWHEVAPKIRREC